MPTQLIVIEDKISLRLHPSWLRCDTLLARLNLLLFVKDLRADSSKVSESYWTQIPMCHAPPSGYSSSTAASWLAPPLWLDSVSTPSLIVILLLKTLFLH